MNKSFNNNKKFKQIEVLQLLKFDKIMIQRLNFFWVSMVIYNNILLILKVRRINIKVLSLLYYSGD